jgi:lysophospholipase L1-like esterase
VRDRLWQTGAGPLFLQEHLSPVRFRNVWIRPLDGHAERYARAQGQTITIGLIGDSTIASTYGWGPAFAHRFNDQTKVLNYAKNGATLESLSKNLDALVKRKPDYVLIQFGHNDQKRYDTKVYGDKLRSYVQRITEAGGKAIIVSSVTRRNFDEHGRIKLKLGNEPGKPFKAKLAAYAQAAQAVAQELKVPFIDLHTLSVDHHNRIGPETSAAYNFIESDTTHFSKRGAYAIADLVLKELQAVVPELVDNLK